MKPLLLTMWHWASHFSRFVSSLYYQKDVHTNQYVIKILQYAPLCEHKVCIVVIEKSKKNMETFFDRKQDVKNSKNSKDLKDKISWRLKDLWTKKLEICFCQGFLEDVKAI